MQEQRAALGTVQPGQPNPTGVLPHGFQPHPVCIATGWVGLARFNRSTAQGHAGQPPCPSPDVSSLMAAAPRARRARAGPSPAPSRAFPRAKSTYLSQTARHRTPSESVLPSA